MEITVFSTHGFSYFPVLTVTAKQLSGPTRPGPPSKALFSGAAVSTPQGWRALQAVLSRHLLRAGPGCTPSGPPPLTRPHAPLAPCSGPPPDCAGSWGGLGGHGWLGPSGPRSGPHGGSHGGCHGGRQACCPGPWGGLGVVVGSLRVSLRRPRGRACRPAGPGGGGPPAAAAGCEACREPHFLLRGLLKTTGLRARAGGPQGAGGMAEGKAGGAAGLFAKQVQKKLSRAQEKVGGQAWRPAGSRGPGPATARGGAGCLGPRVLAEEKGRRFPQKGERRRVSLQRADVRERRTSPALGPGQGKLRRQVSQQR